MWNLICILYSKYVYTWISFYACLLVLLHVWGKISCACIYRARRLFPVRARASTTAYNRINAVIRTSLQCNLPTLQSSKVFMLLYLLCRSFTFGISFSPGVGSRDAMSAFRKFTFDAIRTVRTSHATRLALHANYYDIALCGVISLFDVMPLNYTYHILLRISRCSMRLTIVQNVHYII